VADDDNLPADQKVRRSVARTLGNGAIVLLLLAGLAGWGWLGIYQLDPGQSAIILRIGRHVDTVAEPGLKWHLPPPFETHEIVNVAQIDRQEFGAHSGGEGAAARARDEAEMQTSDNNIVQLGFVVQYRIQDAFASRYRVADPIATLRDAAQAAVREVVGGMTIDGVLSERRGDVEADSQVLLQDLLDRYEAGIFVTGVELQEVQPPEPVAAAFDDVVAAAQDANRAVNEAEGYRNELLPRARAEAAELEEGAHGYRDAKIAESEGEAGRFAAIAAEHRKAPEVTERRLYLETMETVLPPVEKVIIEPGTAQVLPYLPLGGRMSREVQ
jgi:membrane protease subunit HflK